MKLRGREISLVLALLLPYAGYAKGVCLHTVTLLSVKPPLFQEDPYSENVYERLGLTQKASIAEIKKRKRRLAEHYHPDRNPGIDRRAFQNVWEAAEMLLDSTKRAAYDRTGAHVSRPATQETVDPTEPDAIIREFRFLWPRYRGNEPLPPDDPRIQRLRNLSNPIQKSVFWKNPFVNIDFLDSIEKLDNPAQLALLNTLAPPNSTPFYGAGNIWMQLIPKLHLVQNSMPIEALKMLIDQGPRLTWTIDWGSVCLYHHPNQLEMLKSLLERRLDFTVLNDFILNHPSGAAKFSFMNVLHSDVPELGEHMKLVEALLKEAAQKQIEFEASSDDARSKAFDDWQTSLHESRNGKKIVQSSRAASVAVKLYLESLSRSWNALPAHQ